MISKISDPELLKVLLANGVKVQYNDLHDAKMKNRSSEFINILKQEWQKQVLKKQHEELKQNKKSAIDKLEQQKALIAYLEKMIKLQRQYFQKGLKPLEERLTALKNKSELSAEDKHSIVQLEKAIELYKQREHDTLKPLEERLSTYKEAMQTQLNEL